MIRAKMHAALGLTSLAVLTACGSAGNDNSGSITGQLIQATRAATTQRQASPDTETRTPQTPQEMAATALRVNPGPLILVGMENAGRTQVMAMTGQNGAQRTYMNPNEQALILRDGMLSGTRGLGNDLSVAEMAQSSAMIRAGQSGQTTRTMRYWTGDGLERPLPMNCQIQPGPNPGVMLESCEGLGAKFQNNYLVQNGRITVSRQWVGGALGYVTIQELRP